MTPSERYLASFPPGVVEFAVRGLDVLDVPLHSAALQGSAAHPGGSGIGYGATQEQARTGALGEMAEMALSVRAHQGAERVQASYAELVAREGADRVQDPLTLCLEAGSAYDRDRVLQWLPMTRLRDGERVLVPAELVASAPEDLPGAPPPGGWLTTVITNGQGAAFDADAATAHALLEVLQRDGNATAFRAMDRGTVVDLDGLTDPDSLALLDRLRAAGIDVLVKLASTDLGVVDVYAVGCSGDEQVPVMATACGEAAHPDREVAIRKALHEFAAARSRKAFMHGPLDRVRAATPEGYLDRWLQGHPPERMVEEDRALQAMLDWTRRGTGALVDLLRDSVLSRRGVVPLADLPAWSGDDLCGHVTGTLSAAGYDVLVELQPSQGEAVAAKVLVPGLEVETMSYARVGERGVRRLLEQDEGLVAVGAQPDGWARVHLTQDAEQRLGGPAWFDRAGADRRVGPLYALYREPGRHVAAQVPLPAVDAAARRLAADLVLDEERDVVRWRGPDGGQVETGLHDYAALYAVQGLYEAVYLVRLEGGSPQLLADALAEAVPAGERAGLRVLDVGAGTGAVGERLHAAGFRSIAATDLEPASEVAVRRDRAEAYTDVRTLDLLDLDAGDEAWLDALAPSVVTVAGAVGFGHLPVGALHVLTQRLPAGGLLALTVARDVERAPELAEHAALLLGPAYTLRTRREGLHRRTATGGRLEVAALVLERTQVPA